MKEEILSKVEEILSVANRSGGVKILIEVEEGVVPCISYEITEYKVVENDGH